MCVVKVQKYLKTIATSAYFDLQTIPFRALAESLYTGHLLVFILVNPQRFLVRLRLHSLSKFAGNFDSFSQTQDIDHVKLDIMVGRHLYVVMPLSRAKIPPEAIPFGDRGTVLHDLDDVRLSYQPSSFGSTWSFPALQGSCCNVHRASNNLQNSRSLPNFRKELLMLRSAFTVSVDVSQINNLHFRFLASTPTQLHMRDVSHTTPALPLACDLHAS